MSSGELSVIEIFGPTIQGEGELAGKWSHFIRLGGCGYRCTWCDTMQAVDPELVKQNSTKMSVKTIMAQIMMLPDAPWVTISGGDPMVWKNHLQQLSKDLKRQNFKVAIETQGQILPGESLDYFDLITVSPKPPSSGMDGKFDSNVIRAYLATQLGNRGSGMPWPKVVFKIAAFTDEDLDWIEDLHALFPKVPLYITPGTHQLSPEMYKTYGETQLDHYKAAGVLDNMRRIYERILMRPNLKYATAIPQLHVLAWGDKKGV